MSVEDLLTTAFNGGVAWLDLFRQLVLVCGGILDQAVHSGHQDERMDINVICMPDLQSDRMKPRLKNKLVEHLRRATIEKMAQRRCQYIFAIRRAFHQETTVHLAIDASSMGQEQAFSACIALPSGICAACLPQAFRQTVGGHQELPKCMVS